MNSRSAIRLTANSFVFLFIVYLVEKIFLPASYSLITLIGGFLFWVIYMINLELSTNNGFRAIGVQTPVRNFFGSFAVSAALFILSFAATLVIEELLYLILGGKGLFFDPSDHLQIVSNSGIHALGSVGLPSFSLWALASIGLRLLRALFLEGYFRGVLIHVNAVAADYKRANIRQSVLFTLWSSVPIIWTAVQYNSQQTNSSMIGISVMAVLLYLLSSYLQAYRHGILRFVRGNVWICVFQMWMFDFCGNVFRAPLAIAHSSPMMYFSVILRGVLLQVVASALTMLYVHSTNKKAKENVQASIQAAGADPERNTADEETQPD